MCSIVKIARIGKSIETESRLVTSGGGYREKEMESES